MSWFNEIYCEQFLKYITLWLSKRCCRVSDGNKWTEYCQMKEPLSTNWFIPSRSVKWFVYFKRIFRQRPRCNVYFQLANFVPGADNFACLLNMWSAYFISGWVTLDFASWTRASFISLGTTLLVIFMYKNCC